MFAIADLTYTHPSASSHKPTLHSLFSTLSNESPRTVSKIPLALGRPSNLTGLFPIYLPILSSRGSSAWFHAAAAAFANPISRISRRLHAPVLPNRFSSRPFLYYKRVSTRGKAKAGLGDAYRMRSCGTYPSIHLPAGYSPCTIWCSDSNVRGTFVERK